MKKAIVSIINDLATDQRVNRTCLTLTQMGFKVLLVGRVQKNSLILAQRTYATERMHLLFNKGVLFYAEYQIRLFFFLLFKKADVLISNDLDTLLPNYLIAKIKKAVLIYDTHEIFTEVPELQQNQLKRKLWERLEKWILPQLQNVFTVNESIANYYHAKYGIKLNIVKNIPISKLSHNVLNKKDLGLPADKKIIVLQGAGININRGAEEAVQSMQYVEDAILLVIGGGDIISLLKVLASELHLSDKIKFIDKLPFDELQNYTRLADIGLTLDKNTNINYQYSLPNKLFDYIHAGIAILASPLVEIKKIMDEYQIGECIDNHSPKHIADKINGMLASPDKLELWKMNAQKAALKLNWENEQEKLITIVKQFV